LIELIDTAVRDIGDELAEGVALASSGFETVHRIPIRVVKEAIVNAVIHRDYRLNRDIFVRIFDNRIEIESPGALPGTVTVANIGHVGSRTRNPLIARTLRDFPVRPNVDAGEGVRMMFDEMAQRSLYPPLYRESELAAGSVVTVVLMCDSKPPLWDAVSEWIDRNGPIGTPWCVGWAD
jgi:ATP-dependent DNA helicase RecG